MTMIIAKWEEEKRAEVRGKKKMLVGRARTTATCRSEKV